MSQNGLIQSAAHRSITGFTGPVMLATLIVSLLGAAAGSCYGLALLIAGPLDVGYKLFNMKIMDEKVVDYNRLFAGFNNFVQTLIAGLLYSLIVGIGFFFLIVPGIIAACGLGMTFIIMAEDDKIEGIQALQMSWNMMKGRKWEYFCLCCRFIGWLLLGILTFGILFLWVQPWMQMSYINFYRKLKYGQY